MPEVRSAVTDVPEVGTAVANTTLMACRGEQEKGYKNHPRTTRAGIYVSSQGPADPMARTAPMAVLTPVPVSDC